MRCQRRGFSYSWRTKNPLFTTTSSKFSAFRNVDGLKVGHFRFTEESTDRTEPKLSDMPLVDFATDANEFNNDGEHPANARYSMQVVAEEVSDPAKWDLNYRLRPGEKAPAR